MFAMTLPMQKKTKLSPFRIMIRTLRILLFALAGYILLGLILESVMCLARYLDAIDYTEAAARQVVQQPRLYLDTPDQVVCDLMAADNVFAETACIFMRTAQRVCNYNADINPVANQEKYCTIVRNKFPLDLSVDDVLVSLIFSSRDQRQWYYPTPDGFWAASDHLSDAAGDAWKKPCADDQLTLVYPQKKAGNDEILISDAWQVANNAALQLTLHYCHHQRFNLPIIRSLFPESVRFIITVQQAFPQDLHISIGQTE